MNDTRIEDALTAFKAAETVEEANHALKKLSPLEKLQQLYAISPSDMHCLGNGTHYFRIGEDHPTSDEDLEALYKQTFRMLVAAKQKADDEGKPLRILLGEMHGDRTGLAAGLMVYAIAKRIGVQNFGVERPKESFESPYGHICGIREILEKTKNAENEPVSEMNTDEYSGTMTILGNVGVRKNDWYFAQFMQQKDIAVFGSDDKHTKSWNSTDRSQEGLAAVLKERDEGIIDKLDHFANQKQSAISQHGTFHLHLLDDLSDREKAYTLILTTLNTLSISKGEQPPAAVAEFFANSEIVDADNAEAFGKGERGTKLPVLHIPGRGFDTAANAYKAAQDIDNQLGPELAKELLLPKGRVFDASPATKAAQTPDFTG